MITAHKALESLKNKVDISWYATPEELAAIEEACAPKPETKPVVKKD